MRLHLDWRGGVVEDAIHLLDPGIKCTQVFPVLVGTIVAAGPGTLVNEIEDHRGRDIHHAHVTSKLVKPLQTIFLFVKSFLGKIDLAVRQIPLGKSPERQVLAARRKPLLVVLEALLFVFYPLPGFCLVLKESLCAYSLAVQQEVCPVAPFGFPDAHRVPSSSFAMTRQFW